MATTPLLQTTTAEISDVIENREVVQLPLNGRNFIALAQLSDAVVIPPGGTRGGALGQAGQLPNVGGQRSGHNIYLVDGAKVTDELFNNLVLNPSIDSIEEFKIQKSMYPAEFGGKASALINVATKAGSNAFRGSVFEFHRNEAFDSRNYFQPANQPLPPLRQNQFGGALGGPLVAEPDVLLRQLRGHAGCGGRRRSVFSVPTAAVRSGNFAGLAAICDPLTIPADRRLHAVREQPDSRRAASIRSPRRFWSTCRCRRPAPSSRTSPPRRSRRGTCTSSARASTIGWPTPISCSRASARSTPTISSPSAPARSRNRSCRDSDGR